MSESALLSVTKATLDQIATTCAPGKEIHDLEDLQRIVLNQNYALRMVLQVVDLGTNEGGLSAESCASLVETINDALEGK